LPPYQPKIPKATVMKVLQRVPYIL